MQLLKESRASFYGYVSFKFLPLWLTKFLTFTGLVNLYTSELIFIDFATLNSADALLFSFTDYFRLAKKTAAEVVAGLTQDQVWLRPVSQSMVVTD